MYSLLRPMLFRLDAEHAHNLVLGTLSLASRSRVTTAALATLAGAQCIDHPVTTMGIRFPNPVGLAAGLDKQGSAANALARMGFGWVELGTVTPRPQPGNPHPRMFRLEEHQALINRMGFNSDGMEVFLNNVEKTEKDIILGINIGKNAATPLSEADRDYLSGLEDVFKHADYIAINISSPNTRDLRKLQQHDALDRLLCALDQKRQELVQEHGRAMPLVVKIAPDIDDEEVHRICQLLRQHHMDGVAATNTTVSREDIAGHPLAHETGGLSGPPVRALSTHVIRSLNENLQGEIPIIGIGGIDSAEAAAEKFDAGATLIQLYTGFIYQGPSLVRQIVDSLDSARIS